MAAGNNYTGDVIARLQEYFSSRTQWQRTLWRVGPAFALHELIESAYGVQNGALSRAALRGHAQSVARMLGNNPAAGGQDSRRRLLQLLTCDLSSGGANYHELDLWREDLERNALGRWRTAVGAEQKPSREQFARAIACELFRHGFSAARLGPWIHHIRVGGDLVYEQDLVDRAMELIATEPRDHKVLLTFEKPLPSRIQRPPQARDAAECSRWLLEHGFDRVRQHGGLLLEISARDRYAAAQIAADIADRLRARTSVGTRDKLRLHDVVFVAGHPTPIVASRSRRAEVRALEREQRLLDLDAGDNIDQALELLANLNTAPAPVAAAAGWAAVESLLSGPGDEDKVITAERLANLVACSWPRAELTTIAWARIKQLDTTDNRIAEELASFETNRERAERVLTAIREEEPMGLVSLAERLAVQRMHKLTRAPRRELLAVREHAGDALRRLYRQRNLVVHGGLTAGFGLSAALRTAAPLVGAGLDRVTHASLTSDRSPLEIAARARLEVERADMPDAPLLTRMLD